MSSMHRLQGPSSSNAMSAAAEARRAAYARPPAAQAENEVRPQETGEGARLATERNEEVSERTLKQRQAERQADLELPGKTGRNIDLMA